MALDKAVLEIADKIEDLAHKSNKTGEKNAPHFMAYAEMLRMAVKAAEGESPKAQVRTRTCSRCYAPWNGEGRECIACQGDKKAREDRDAEQKLAGQQEMNMGRIAVILDGPLFQENQTTTIPIPTDMPINAYMPIQDFWYQLKTTGLRHAPHREEEARKLKVADGEIELMKTGGILLGKE